MNANSAQFISNAMCLAAWERLCIQIELCVKAIICILTFRLAGVAKYRQIMQACSFHRYLHKLREGYFESFPRKVNLFVVSS